jgi:hypothetical protein
MTLLCNGTLNIVIYPVCNKYVSLLLFKYLLRFIFMLYYGCYHFTIPYLRTPSTTYPLALVSIV